MHWHSISRLQCKQPTMFTKFAFNDCAKKEYLTQPKQKLGSDISNFLTWMMRTTCLEYSVQTAK